MSDEPQFNRGGFIPSGPTLATIDPDEHILQSFGGIWVCARPGHERHVCHGNQYDLDTMSWYPRT